MFEYFTDRAIAVVMLAQEEARRLSQASVGTEQLLLGLVREQTSLAAQVLAQMGVTLDRGRPLVAALVGRGSGPVPADIPFTPKTRQVMESAIIEARSRQNRFVGPEHLLLALLHAENVLALQVLQQLEVSVPDLETVLRAEMDRPVGIGAVRDAMDAFDEGSPKRHKASDLKMLKEFGTDLTQKAAEGRLDPVVGRGKETERVVQILSRRSKNNAVLVGEPGVGKTAIAEGLAQRIINGDVPDTLLNSLVISLDLAAVVAGTRFRGEFEERLTQILAEVRTAGNVILVIDEIHTLMGAGVMGSGGADAANLMKPALARGEIQCLGATTLEEFRKYIERDAALERRFQSVMVGEPTVDETVEILRGIRVGYEHHHRVTITDAALKAAAELSDRYITDRFLPDKAIDLIDEAASRVQLRFSQLKASKDHKRTLRQVSQAKQDAVRTQDFGQAARLRDQELGIEAQIRSQHIAQASSEELAILNSQLAVVDAEDIAQVLEAWTGVPAMKLTESESMMLMHLEDNLHARVIGQGEAVTAVARAMRRSRVNLANPNKPIASFFFSGPTGVGKTELSKALAELLFGSEDAIIRFDMSEYMESHTISKLIGAPPGFIGYEDSGKLTEAVRRRPYSLILFDEVEKAHPDIFNVLLQVLDDGRLSDSKGRVVNFKNTVIIMTSNLGAKAIEKGGMGLGFTLGSDAESQYEGIRDRVTEDLKQFFRPEFLNRLDEIIVFRQLTQPEVTQIAEIMVASIAQRLRDKGIGLEVSDAVKALAVREGYDPRYGARPLRRALQRLLEDSLAEAILAGQLRFGDMALVDLDDDGRVVVKRQGQLTAVLQSGQI
jgi:ATP-dependent Clp protease ATP-binding subunit ClpC